jgi:hypothetical protein
MGRRDEGTMGRRDDASPTLAHHARAAERPSQARRAVILQPIATLWAQATMQAMQCICGRRRRCRRCNASVGAGDDVRAMRAPCLELEAHRPWQTINEQRHPASGCLCSYLPAVTLRASPRRSPTVVVGTTLTIHSSDRPFCFFATLHDPPPALLPLSRYAV